MISLIRNEWMKIFSRVSSYVYIAFLILALLVVAILDFKFDDTAKGDWREKVNSDIEVQQSILADKDVSKEEKDEAVAEIAKYQGYLDQNINPYLSNVWTYLNEYAVSIMSFITLFTVIIASATVSSEFSDGTIKQLLIRPHKRWKILLSKYLTSLLFAALLVGALLLSGYIIGLLFFGNGSFTEKMIDPTSYEGIKTVSVGGFLIDNIVYWIPGFIMIVTIAFMLSTLFRSQAIAVGIAVFILFASQTLNVLISSFVPKYGWLKYVLFPHLDMRRYISDAMPMFDGATIGLSLGVLTAYYLIFMAFTFFFFQKRDVSI